MSTTTTATMTTATTATITFSSPVSPAVTPAVIPAANPAVEAAIPAPRVSPDVRRTGRTLVLLDVENLLGTPRVLASEVNGLRAILTDLLSLPGDAHVVVGASSSGVACEAGLGWMGARLVWVAGKDGADMALSSIITDEGVAQRYGHVIIGSGDGHFAEFARELVYQDVDVTVLSRREGLSRELRLAVPRVCFLPERQTYGLSA